ncbi:adhesin biosynthesis transcription regulatory family protein, partial [Cronobacter muytjensii]|uniref:adhesin biosynthesis transcription regulatory family protein n=3 Tax=Enterobacteriaceae TaxID=543 RepID=UPI001F2D57FB
SKFNICILINLIHCLTSFVIEGGVSMRMFWGGPIRGDKYDSPGSMSEGHFEILLSLTPINSQKVKLALKDYFVDGCTRKKACDRNNVSQGYFSISMRKVMQTNRLVASIAEFYMPKRF